jgi:type IV pilus assembly protein PilV
MSTLTVNPPRKQQGSMLLEALIAILIFSMGILAIVGLQATSVKLSGDAKYRSDASLLVNQLIGQMWVSDRTPATLQANFQGAAGNGGAAYTAWLATVQDTQSGLPGTAANPPSVVIVPVAGTTTTSSLVTITLWWQAPTELSAHSYTAVAQII